MSKNHLISAVFVVALAASVAPLHCRAQDVELRMGVVDRLDPMDAPSMSLPELVQHARQSGKLFKSVGFIEGTAGTRIRDRPRTTSYSQAGLIVVTKELSGMLRPALLESRISLRGGELYTVMGSTLRSALRAGQESSEWKALVSGLGLISFRLIPAEGGEQVALTACEPALRTGDELDLERHLRFLERLDYWIRRFPD